MVSGLLKRAITSLMRRSTHNRILSSLVLSNAIPNRLSSFTMPQASQVDRNRTKWKQRSRRDRTTTIRNPDWRWFPPKRIYDTFGVAYRWPSCAINLSSLRDVLTAITRVTSWNRLTQNSEKLSTKIRTRDYKQSLKRLINGLAHCCKTRPGKIGLSISFIKNGAHFFCWPSGPP